MFCRVAAVNVFPYIIRVQTIFSDPLGSGGAVVLGKLPVPGRPTSLNYSKARTHCANSRYGWELFRHFFLSSVISLFFLPLSGRRPDID